MNILQVIPYFVPAWDYGGPVQVAYRVSAEMVKRGHSLTVFTTDVLSTNSENKDRIEKREEVIDGIRVRRFRNLSNNLACRHKVFLSPAMLPALRNEISKIDVIHMHEYRSFQNIIAHHYAKKHRIPYVLQAHGSLPILTARQRQKQVYDTLWGYKLLRDAAGVVALSETEAERYHSMGVDEEKIKIMPNGIDPSEFSNLPSGEEFRKQYGLYESDRIILYLGRIHETKGLDLLVKAFAGLAGEIDNAKLVIVGPDEGYLGELTELAQNLKIKDRILFTGPIYGRNRLGAYVSANIFVTPAFLGFPVTFVEACACGTPIITTDRGDRLNWIHNQVGYVVAYDKDELKDAMVKILTSRELTRQFSENGRRLVQDKFNWTRITDGLEQIYLKAKAVY